MVGGGGSGPLYVLHLHEIAVCRGLILMVKK